jgi:hypothetical protein
VVFGKGVPAGIPFLSCLQLERIDADHLLYASRAQEDQGRNAPVGRKRQARKQLLVGLHRVGPGLLHFVDPAQRKGLGEGDTLALVRTLIRYLQMSACAFSPEGSDSAQISIFADLGETPRSFRPIAPITSG